MKKVFLVLFSLIMMCSVSFGIETGVIYKSFGKTTCNSSTLSDDFLLGGYTEEEVISILKNMTNDSTNTTYIDLYNTLLENLDNEGLQYISYIYKNSSKNEYWLAVENPEIDIDLDFFICNTTLGVVNHNNTSIDKGCYFFAGRGTPYVHSCANFTSNTKYCDLIINGFITSNTDVYQMTSSSGGYIWDGESYYYKHTSSGGNEGGNTGNNTSDFTDEQIAEIVERFINSDAYLDKAYYDGNYFITYDNLTGYFRGYSYSWNIDLAIEYGNYNEEGEFITTGTKEGEAYRIRPYEFSGDIFNKFGDWLASKFNTYSFEYFSISSDSTIEPRYVGSLEHNYCSNYVENEVVIYSSKQIRYVGEETNEEGKTETVVTDNYIPPTVLKDSETGEEIIIRDNLQNSSDSLENVITPNADFSGLKQAFEKYISFINISSITWLAPAVLSMVTIFIPFVALGIIIFLINRVLNGGS